MHKSLSKVIVVAILGICLFLTFNMHRAKESFTYKSEIWADKAGYYIYLPAFFIYKMNSAAFPKKYAENTGQGFSLTSDHKFSTKYSCGVAILQAPFFLATHFYQRISHRDASGFSLPYQQAINVAAVFYGTIGLLLLSIFLKRFLEPKVVYTSLFVIFMGTNFYYYLIAETGMSHIYSFFLFSAFLVLSGKVYQSYSQSYHYILLGLVIGLIIVVRPINMIFLPVFFVIRQEPLFDVIKKIYYTPLKYTLIVLLCVLLMLIPQLLYWDYISGQYIHYGYTDEGFIYLLSPKILHLWFSTNNGLFTYSPLFALALAGLFFMRKEDNHFRYYAGIYFLAISYLFGSWWFWSYGCGYGSRPFVEYYTIFALPLGYFIQKTFRLGYLKYIVAFFVILLIVVNLKFIYNYDGCWYGSTWDIQEYLNVLRK